MKYITHFSFLLLLDINECEDKGRCQHLCENTQGSYRCLCPAGYQLGPFGKKCQGIIFLQQLFFHNQHTKDPAINAEAFFCLIILTFSIVYNS